MQESPFLLLSFSKARASHAHGGGQLQINAGPTIKQCDSQRKLNAQTSHRKIIFHIEDFTTFHNGHVCSVMHENSFTGTIS